MFRLRENIGTTKFPKLRKFEVLCQNNAKMMEWNDIDSDTFYSKIGKKTDENKSELMKMTEKCKF